MEVLFENDPRSALTKLVQNETAMFVLTAISRGVSRRRKLAQFCQLNRETLNEVLGHLLKNGLALEVGPMVFMVTGKGHDILEQMGLKPAGGSSFIIGAADDFRVDEDFVLPAVATWRVPTSNVRVRLISPAVSGGGTGTGALGLLLSVGMPTLFGARRWESKFEVFEIKMSDPVERFRSEFSRETSREFDFALPAAA